MAEETEEVELAWDHRCCLAVVLSISLLMLFSVFNVQAVELEYAPQTKPAPLKGLESRRDGSNSFHWFYLPLKSVMVASNEFNWDRLEISLRNASQKGKSLILRPVLDLYSSQPQLPFFLTNISGATYKIEDSNQFFGYPKNGIVPIYTHPETRTAITGFIQAFAAKYDGDPRIAFIETGIIGTWGEWWNVNMQRWPQTSVPPEVSHEVLQTYQAHFKQTKLLMRWPDKGFQDFPFGYHDDWFAFWKRSDTLYRKQTNAGLPALVRWQTQPIGGRLHPEFCSPPGNEVPPIDEISPDHLLELIKRDHISWLRYPYENLRKMPSVLQANLETIAPKMGYELHVLRANWKQQGKTLRMEVAVTNTAVAPFYYPWKVEVGLWRGNQLQQTWPLDWDLTRIIPGEGVITYQTTIKDFPAERDSRLLLHVVNPLTNGFPLRFANKTQDADLDGWLTLGGIGEN